MAAAADKPQSVEEQIEKLNNARKLVLGDATFYPKVVPGIITIIGPDYPVEMRRWGADFVAEAFSTPALPLSQKETLSLLVLETIKNIVENPKEDVYVLRSAILAAASIYPLAMRWIINNSYDGATWERLGAIKSRILRIWEGAPSTVKICCVKFVQRVVLAQTAAGPMEQKRDGLDISLAMVPASHTLLDPRQLEAEATGLLDRMLGILQENSGDTLAVDATLNTLGVLVRTRPSTSNRIVNSLLNFNPLKGVTPPLSPKAKVLAKSMEKTTRMLLIHLVKRDPHNPQNPRIQQYVERLMRSRAEIIDDGGRKRAMVEQQQAAYEHAKRQKLAGAQPVPSGPQIGPLGPGPHTLADIFSFTPNKGLAKFDVSQLPLDVATRITVSTLATVDAQVLDRALKGVQDRLNALKAEAEPAALNPETAPLGVEEDDDDYEPDFHAAEDTEQILNKLDSTTPSASEAANVEIAAALTLGAFKLPPPQSVSADLARRVGTGTVSRVIGMMQSLDDPAVKKTKSGLNRLAASSHDRDSWITILTRLATRSTSALDGTSHVKSEDDVMPPALANTIRQSLFEYIIPEFRKRIDLAISWLSEEWYADAINRKHHASLGDNSIKPPSSNYDYWASKLIEGFASYLLPQDKFLTRFLGEIPELNPAILGCVKRLCRDPSMVPLALTSLLYLVMMRPPARTLALDTVQDVWIEYEDARPMAGKYLSKWRPGFIEAQQGAMSVGKAPETKMGIAAA